MMEPATKKLRPNVEYSDEAIEREISEAWRRLHGGESAPFPAPWVEAARRQGERDAIELARKFYRSVATPCLAQVRALVMNNGHYQTADPPMPRDMVFAVRYAAKPQVERVARILKRCIRLRHDGLADNEIDAEIKKHVAKVRSINTSPKSEEVAAASSMATTGLGMSLTIAHRGARDPSMSESFHRTQVLLHTLKMGEDLKKSSRKPEQQEHIGKVLDALREEAVVSFSFLASHFLEQSDSMRQSLKTLVFPTRATSAETSGGVVSPQGATIAPAPPGVQVQPAALATDIASDLATEDISLSFAPPKEELTKPASNGVYNGAAI